MYTSINTGPSALATKTAIGDKKYNKYAGTLLKVHKTIDVALTLLIVSILSWGNRLESQ